jgi:hypothetical protein
MGDNYGPPSFVAIVGSLPLITKTLLVILSLTVLRQKISKGQPVTIASVLVSLPEVILPLSS